MPIPPPPAHRASRYFAVLLFVAAIAFTFTEWFNHSRATSPTAAAR